MLGKLLKYDLKALGRLLLPLYGAVILVGFISIFFFSNSSFSNGLFDTFSFYRIMMVLVYILYTVLIIAALALCFILPVIHFKNNLLGSQGYLMNTLPVNANTHITSVLIASCLYQILAMFVSLFTMMFSVLASADTDIWLVLKQIPELLRTLGEDPIIILRLLEIAVLCLIALIGANLMLYASMAVGHSFSARKTFKSILVFIGFYIVTQIISSFLIAAFASPVGIFYSDMYQKIPDLPVLGIILLEIVYAAGYWFITSYFLKNKLNLQ